MHDYVRLVEVGVPGGWGLADDDGGGGGGGGGAGAAGLKALLGSDDDDNYVLQGVCAAGDGRP